jgi:hypothetical protein
VPTKMKTCLVHTRSTCRVYYPTVHCKKVTTLQNSLFLHDLYHTHHNPQLSYMRANVSIFTSHHHVLAVRVCNCDHSVYSSLYRYVSLLRTAWAEDRLTMNSLSVWSLIFPLYFEVHPLQYLNEKDKFTSWVSYNYANKDC